MTVVVGTAGHIDHGKTTLLRALTGIDADRLPDERRRGMTLDVGYAHLPLDGGAPLDFVDVPGHDRLVGNMLVGAGEIDAVLLVVAADDGPRAQTREHLALLDALGIHDGIVVVTKVDAVSGERLAAARAEVAALVEGTGLASAPVVAVSGTSGTGIDVLRAELEMLRRSTETRRAGAPARPPRLAVDRVFSVKGRGTVVTGTLRGAELRRGDVLRAVPGDGSVRIREIQVHGSTVEAVAGGGRTALNVVAEGAVLRRGTVLTSDPGVFASDRLLVRCTGDLRDRARFRLHAGTDAVEVAIGRSGRDGIDFQDGSVGAMVRLDAPVAVAPGDRFVLRRSTPATVIGGVVLDPQPPRGVSRRRQTGGRVAGLAEAVGTGYPAAIAAARTVLHGVTDDGLAADLRDSVRNAAVDAVAADHAEHPDAAGPTIAAVRSAAARALRHGATVRGERASVLAGEEVAALVADRVLVREDGRLRSPGHTPAAADPGLAGAMDRLERSLACLAPPRLSLAALVAGCPPAGVRDLERRARIAVLAPDLAYAMTTYRELAATALRLAARGPMTPAAFRDATGTSRKYVMPILEDLDRRGILRRTAEGHVPGPRAPVSASETASS